VRRIEIKIKQRRREDVHIRQPPPHHFSVLLRLVKIFKIEDNMTMCPLTGSGHCDQSTLEVKLNPKHRDRLRRPPRLISQIIWVACHYACEMVPILFLPLLHVVTRDMLFHYCKYVELYPGTASLLGVTNQSCVHMPTVASVSVLGKVVLPLLRRIIW
jgi:hypothetical protein